MGFVNLPTAGAYGSAEELVKDILLYLASAPRISAFCVFDGVPATPAIVIAQNVSPAITRLGVGNYRLIFQSPYVGSRYTVFVNVGGGAVQLVGRAYNKTATTVDVAITTLGGVATDANDCQLLVVDIPQ
jgi:hypothetical protein